MLEHHDVSTSQKSETPQQSDHALVSRNPTHQAPRWLRTLAAVLCLVFATILGAFSLFALWSFAMLKTGKLTDQMLQHFPAFVGLPVAALAASGLLFFFEITHGTLEFEVAGVKVKGASGPLVLWTLAFLAITVAIKLLW